jgi:hypothetical protein
VLVRRERHHDRLPGILERGHHRTVRSPADAGYWARGRPWPDIPLTALLRLRGGAVSELAVAGDTASDVESVPVLWPAVCQGG